MRHFPAKLRRKFRSDSQERMYTGNVKNVKVNNVIVLCCDCESDAGGGGNLLQDSLCTSGGKGEGGITYSGIKCPRRRGDDLL